MYPPCDDAWAMLDDPEDALPNVSPSDQPSIAEPVANEEEELTIMDTFAPQPSAVKRSAPGSDVHAETIDPAAMRASMPDLFAESPSAAAPSKRGRKKGSTAHQRDLQRLLSPPAPKAPPPRGPARADICAVAGKASAAKRSANSKKVSKRDSDVPNPNAAHLEALEVIMVPVEAAVQPALWDTSAVHDQIISWQPPICAPADLPKTESGILQDGLRIQSKALLAKRLGVSPQTVTRKFRLMASLVVVCRRAFAVRDIESLDSYLHAHFGVHEVRRMLFILKHDKAPY